MTPPSIRDIQDDNDLIDALGARKGTGSSGDPVAGMLAAWVDEIDHPITRKPGRYARVRRGGARVAMASVVVAGALSVSSVAAAVTGTQLPVFSQLGHLTNSIVGGGHTTHTTTPAGVVDDVAGTTNTGTVSAPEDTTSSPSTSDSSSATAVPPTVTDPDRPSSSSSVRIPPPVVHPPHSTRPERSDPGSDTSDPSSRTSTSQSTSGPTSGPTSTSGPTQPTEPVSPPSSGPTDGPTSTRAPRPSRPTQPTPTPSGSHKTGHGTASHWPSAGLKSALPQRPWTSTAPDNGSSTMTGKPRGQQLTGGEEGTSSPTPSLPVGTGSADSDR